MDEFLSEKEQIERLRQWWRENGWFLIGGVALGLFGILGWNQYQAYQDRQAEAAAALYHSLVEAVDGNNESEAVALLTRLRNEHPRNAYSDQGGLLLARQLLVSSPDRAAEELRVVMERTDERELALVARLRLARVLAYREQYSEALALLDVDDLGQFAGRFNEVKGDILAAQGQNDAARLAYLAALTSSGSEVLDRNFLQMKLNDLSPSMPGRSDAAPLGDVAPEPDPSVEDTPAPDESAAGAEEGA